jgi:ABC transport system ATP-binding/permease protein
MANVGGTGDTVTINGQPRHISGYLRDFLFPPERLLSPVKMLSGGERNRLLLARLFAQPANLLVLDEPTNDLDVETLDLLEELIAGFDGTMLLVSHDRAFLDNVVTSTLVFEGAGRVVEYVGGYTDWVRQRAPAPGSAQGKKAAAAKTAVPEKPAAKKAKLSYKDQRELEMLPEKIQRLEAEQATLTATIGDAAFYQKPHAEVSAALARMEALTGELETAFARWEALDLQSQGG